MCYICFYAMALWGRKGERVFPMERFRWEFEFTDLKNSIYVQRTVMIYRYISYLGICFEFVSNSVQLSNTMYLLHHVPVTTNLSSTKHVTHGVVTVLSKFDCGKGAFIPRTHICWWLIVYMYIYHSFGHHKYRNINQNM